MPVINSFELKWESCLWNLETFGIDSDEIIDVHYGCGTILAPDFLTIFGAGETDGLRHLFPKRILVSFSCSKSCCNPCTRID